MLVDAGFSARELERRLIRCGIDPSSLTAIVITHEHSDHIKGLNLFSRKYRLNLFSSEKVLECSSIMKKRLSSFHSIQSGIPFDIGEIEVRPFMLPHDAEDTFGFSIRANGAHIAYATDLGFASRLVVEEMKGADAIILEANHDIGMLLDGPYPWFLKERLMSRHGHLSNKGMRELVEEISCGSTRFLVLAHLSEVNNRPDRALHEAKLGAKKAGSKHLKIVVSSQKEITEMVEL